MKYYVITLSGTITESDGIYKTNPLMDQGKTFPLDKFYVLKEDLKKRLKTNRIIIDCQQDFTGYPGQLEEVYRYISELRENGKELYFYSKNYETKELYLSSICQNRLLPENGQIRYLGYALNSRYYKNLLDKLNINVDIFRRGKYKGAGDKFRIDSIDDNQREAYGLILKSFSDLIENTLKTNFNTKTDFIKYLKDGNIYRSFEALESGIITNIEYKDNLILDFKDQKYKRDSIKINSLSTGSGDKIAILSFDGNIVDGDNQKNGLMGKSCGDNFYVKEILKLRKKKNIKGVIFKVNSGGGSASASGEMANALLKLKEKKSLVIVQSGVAASGGYFLSFPGEKIFTQKTTITGSIGVIAMVFYTKDFLNKYGVTTSTLKDGEYADIYSSLRNRDEKDRAKIMSSVDYIYDAFISMVAKNRGMTIDNVDKIAQGRIWPGINAIDIGIADEIGGISSAVEYLCNKNNYKTAKLDFYPKRKPDLLSKLLSNKSKQEGMEILNSLGMLKNINRLDNKTLCYLEEALFTDFTI